MNLRLMSTLFVCMMSSSMSYSMTCKDTLTDLAFMSATIQTNAVMCRYKGYNKDGGSAYNAYYIDGNYQPALGDWQLTNRGQYSCGSEDGNTSDCEFILKDQNQ